MAEAQTKPITVDEFLVFQGDPNRRYQLIRGAIVAMAPPHQMHGRLVSRLTRIIGAALPEPCEVVGEAGIRVPNSEIDYYVADMAITCEENRTVWLDAPRVIIEVLSPSTEAFDRTAKLANYVLHPSVEEVVLLSRKRRRIDVVRRTEDWAPDVTIGSGVARIATFNIELGLEMLYARLLP